MGAGLLSGASALFQERSGEIWCEGVPLSRIGDAVGTPCYVYSAGVLRERYRQLADAFRGTRHRVFYSVKANHNVEVLRVFRRLGAGADIVSGGELHRVRRAGFAGPDVVFGGVGKTEPELAAGLDAGVLLFNVESAGELRRLNAIAESRGARAPVALRVNPGVTAVTHAYTQTGHYATKFGVAWEEVESLYAEAARLAGVDPIGIDVHIGSQILSPEPYRAAIGRVVELAGRVRRRGITLRYLDVGGGFGVSYDGAAGLDVGAVAAALAAAATALDLECLLEPGRWLVAPAGVLLARVLDVKRLGERLFYVTDTGSNDFVRPSYYGAVHPIEPVRRAPADSVADVVGPICETGDFLGRERRLPALREGDLLAVGFAGA
ncbi:MAG: diaminopimelate decarboxylase, partial [Gemmatimonadota bacterium]